MPCDRAASQRSHHRERKAECLIRAGYILLKGTRFNKEALMLCTPSSPERAMHKRRTQVTWKHSLQCSEQALGPSSLVKAAAAASLATLTRKRSACKVTCPSAAARMFRGLAWRLQPLAQVARTPREGARHDPAKATPAGADRMACDQKNKRCFFESQAKYANRHPKSKPGL